MDLTALRYFLVLVDEQHFTRAALRLGIAQPALSQRIKRLEAEFGLELVRRSTRAVSITPAGLLLAEHARRTVREADGAIEAMQRLRGLEAGRLVVGVSQTPGAIPVAEILAGFHRRHPRVDLDVREGFSVALLGMLAQGALDIAIVTTPPAAAPEGVGLEPLGAEPLVAVVPRGDPLLARGAVDVQDLAGRALVTFHRGATIRATLEDRAVDAGLALRFSFETADVARMRQLVAHDLAIAVLPTSEATTPGPPVATVGFSGAPMLHRTALATRTGPGAPPAAAAFADVVRAGGAGD